jgi:hypothetical protein
MTFDPFVAQYGAPRAETAASLADLGLAHSAGLEEFSEKVGGGVFADGFLSILSVREKVDGLGGWEAWLPEGSRLFGCGAFGFLMATRGDDVWIVDTQYGQVIESDFTVPEFICELANAETRETHLRASVFDAWSRMAGPLDSRSVLSPTPAIALGGNWAAASLSVMSLPVYLSFTGQMFAPGAGMPAEVRRL